MGHSTLNSVAASSAPSVLLSPEQPSARAMSGQPSDDVLRGVNLAFFAIAMLPIAFMTFITFYRVSRGKDPARIAFTYLKVMLPLAFLSLLMYTISGSLMLIDFDSTRVDWYVLFRVSFHMNLVGGLFSRFADLLLVMTLVEMGNGFLFCHTESRTTLQRVVRYAAIVSCAILAVVAFVAFGIINAVVALSSSPEGKLWKAYEKLYSSSSILLFIWAGILVGFSAHVYNQVKGNSVLRNPSTLFLYAATLNLFTRLYSLVYVSVFLLAGVRIHAPSKTYTAILIAGPILTAWVYAAIVANLVTIAVRKNNGLWSTVQPWHGTEEESHPVLGADPSSTGVDEQVAEESSSAVRD